DAKFPCSPDQSDRPLPHRAAAPIGVRTPFERRGRAGHPAMIRHKATINRLATGIPGLDEVLGGGLPEFSYNLIAGPPGCGKTTLAHQIMFSLATPERPAIYFTVLGEPPLKMQRYQQQYEFFDDDRIYASIRFVNLGDEAAAGDLDQVLRRIVADVYSHGPGLVFVDSFRSVVLANPNEATAHSRVQQFV